MSADVLMSEVVVGVVLGAIVATVGSVVTVWLGHQAAIKETVRHEIRGVALEFLQLLDCLWELEQKSLHHRHLHVTSNKFAVGGMRESKKNFTAVMALRAPIDGVTEDLQRSIVTLTLVDDALATKARAAHDVSKLPGENVKGSDKPTPHEARRYKNARDAFIEEVRAKVT